MTEENEEDYHVSFEESAAEEDGGPSASEESEAAQEREFYGQFRSVGASAERRAPRQLWLISYSDFMTILMIFFLVMYGYTVLAKAAMVKARHQQYSYEGFADVVDRMKKRLGDQLKVQEDVDKVTFQFHEKIMFPSGSANLNPHADVTLEELADSIKLVEGDVIVEGHTDNVPVVAGRFPSNWELSAARAFSVIERLTSKGVDAGRLSAWGFGENRPMVANDTGEHRAQNRRIEVVIMKKKKLAA